MNKVVNGGRFSRFLRDIVRHTPFLQMLALLAVLWMLFATAIYFADRNSPGTHVQTMGEALYWGVAAFSTAGIAKVPVSGIAMALGAVWIVIGSGLFFGTIIAAITGYFMRPMQRPFKKMIETIEFNLEQMDELSVEELDLLKNTVDTLIRHVERAKKKHHRKNSF